MTEYTIYGSELSPYSVKVRAYFRYKGIAHSWILRTANTEGDFRKHAKIAIVPLVLTPAGEALQDSTPMIERLEEEHADPCIYPDDEVTRFVAALLEEFGDEWGNKWMFHYRWAREVDQLSGANRIGRQMMPEANDEVFAGVVQQVRGRMTKRGWFVGSSEQTAPIIEASFDEALDILDAHLSSRLYLFGGRPSFADFSLWGQIYTAWTDPTAWSIVGKRDNVLQWVHRMAWPRNEGAFESWESLEETMMPLLTRQVGRNFVPWTLANQEAIQANEETFSVELGGETWTQKPQKYHAKSLQTLRDKYVALSDKSAVDAILKVSNCLAAFV